MNTTCFNCLKFNWIKTITPNDHKPCRTTDFFASLHLNYWIRHIQGEDDTNLGYDETKIIVIQYSPKAKRINQKNTKRQKSKVQNSIEEKQIEEIKKQSENDEAKITITDETMEYITSRIENK